MAEIKDFDDMLDNEFEDEVIVLEDEDGNEIEFYDVGHIPYEKKEYIFLEPVEGSEGFDEGELLIFEYGEDEDGYETFTSIADEKLLQKLFDMFMELAPGDEE